jgi:hypothetical protein
MFDKRGSPIGKMGVKVTGVLSIRNDKLAVIDTMAKLMSFRLSLNLFDDDDEVVFALDLYILRMLMAENAIISVKGTITAFARSK